MKVRYDGRGLPAVCAALACAAACAAPAAPVVDTPRPSGTAPVATANVIYSADVPAGLWRADRSEVPFTGNFVYLARTGANASTAAQLYTDDMSLVRIVPNVAALTVSISAGDPRIGTFLGANTMIALASGYYAATTGVPFRNATTYGLFDMPPGCAVSGGWYVIDSIVYGQNAITALSLRFEQQCEDGNGRSVLHGEIRWRA